MGENNVAKNEKKSILVFVFQKYGKITNHFIGTFHQA